MPLRLETCSGRRKAPLHTTPKYLPSSPAPPSPLSILIFFIHLSFSLNHTKRASLQLYCSRRHFCSTSPPQTAPYMYVVVAERIPELPISRLLHKPRACGRTVSINALENGKSMVYPLPGGSVHLFGSPILIDHLLPLVVRGFDPPASARPSQNECFLRRNHSRGGGGGFSYGSRQVRREQ